MEEDVRAPSVMFRRMLIWDADTGGWGALTQLLPCARRFMPRLNGHATAKRTKFEGAAEKAGGAGARRVLARLARRGGIGYEPGRPGRRLLAGAATGSQARAATRHRFGTYRDEEFEASGDGGGGAVAAGSARDGSPEVRAAEGG
jgi:hypothetical protein